MVIEMRDIMNVAFYTLHRYIKKPLAIAIFLVAPVLMFIFLSGSSVQYFTPDVKAIPGATCLKNSFVSPADGIKTTDKECIVFMLMYLFYFAVLSCHSVTADLKNGLNTRFKASPVSPFKNILGKSIGNLVLMFGFAVVCVLIGRFVFGVNFGTNYSITLFTLFVFCIITNSLGILLSGFIRNIYVCGILDFALNFPMMFIVMEKIFSPLKVTSFFQIMDTLSLHSYAFNAIVKASAQAVLPLLAIAAVITPLSLLVGRRVLK